MEGPATSTLVAGNGAERLHALDAVRAGALLLGVFLHATMSFLPGPQVWLVRDRQSTALGVLFFVSHMFRMTLFFLLAGFFGRMAYHRRGPRGFIRDRLRRIALPLLACWPISLVSISAIYIWGVVTQYGLAGAQAMAQPGGSGLWPLPLTHLWFLYVLLWFYVAALALRAGVAALDVHSWLRGRVDAVVKALISGGLLPFVLAAPVGLALYWQKSWLLWAGVPTPDRGLVPNPPALLAFGLAFGLGWLLQRQAASLQFWQRRFPLYLAAAVGLTAACVALNGVTAAIDPATQPAAQNPTLRFVFAACYSLAMWAWSIGLIGAALRFLSASRPVVRYLADASYWIYLIHLPIVMALQVVVFRLALPALVKFALVLAVGFPLMLLTYQFLVRYTWVGAILNGRRRRRSGRAPQADKALVQVAGAIE
jgi:peptidoglycan/LPS O-acetylase OafA/YrhL